MKSVPSSTEPEPLRPERLLRRFAAAVLRFCTACLLNYAWNCVSEIGLFIPPRRPNQERHSMRSERWQQVREILDHAISLSPDERSAYLDTACAEDRELRTEVDSLLDSHDQAGSRFLIKPAADLKAAAQHSSSNWIGRRIGVYQ